MLSLQPSLSCGMVGNEYGFRQPPLNFLRCDCKKTLLHVGGFARRLSRYVPLFYCLIALLPDAISVGHVLVQNVVRLFWSLGDRRHSVQAAARKQDFVSPTLQLSSLFNARIPPINYNFQPEFDHSCLGCVSWHYTVEALATVHAPLFSPQARSKPMMALIHASSLVETRKIVSTLDFVNRKLAPDVCHRHGPGSE
jgi:hypothetical protein